MIKELLVGSVVVFAIVAVISAVYLIREYRSKHKKLKSGMVIIGYQGIGKSTLAYKDFRYVDLESSCTKIDGERHDDWFIPYCEHAYSLAQQGYVVFTSSHKVVREYFEETCKDRGVDVYVCFPSKYLKSDWTKKLEKRWEQTESQKDFLAWKNAVDMYDSNIDDLKTSPLPSIIITNMNYDLDAFIKTLEVE